MNVTQKTLGEITEARVEQTGPNGKEFTYVDIGSIELDTKRIVEPKVLPASKAPSRAKQVLKRGDVLVSMTRPNRNAVALVPPELDGAIGSTGFHVLRAKDAEPGFLFYAVQTNDFIDALCEKVQGALYPAVRPRDVSSFKTFLPTSLPEQRRIVAEIEKQFTRLEAGVAALRRVQANLKRYRAAVLKAACEGWPERPLSDVCEAVSGYAFKSSDFCDAGIPVVKIANVSYGSYLNDTPSFLPCTFMPEFRRFQIQAGDILLALTRPITNNQVKTCLYPQELPAALLNQRVAKLAPTEGILRGYLLAFLRSEHFKSAITTVMPQTLQPNLSPRDLASMPIPLPPLAEQTRIVAEVERRLSVVEELESVVSANLQRATRLRQSILQKAFTGEL